MQYLQLGSSEHLPPQLWKSVFWATANMVQLKQLRMQSILYSKICHFQKITEVYVLLAKFNGALYITRLSRQIRLYEHL